MPEFLGRQREDSTGRKEAQALKRRAQGSGKSFEPRMKHVNSVPSGDGWRNLSALPADSQFRRPALDVSSRRSRRGRSLGRKSLAENAHPLLPRTTFDCNVIVTCPLFPVHVELQRHTQFQGQSLVSGKMGHRRRIRAFCLALKDPLPIGLKLETRRVKNREKLQQVRLPNVIEPHQDVEVAQGHTAVEKVLVPADPDFPDSCNHILYSN